MDSQFLAGYSILIVEDEPLVLFDIEATFVDAGASVSTAVSLDDAVRMIEHPALSGAVLDFGIGGHDLCRRLKERGIPFILHSGYGLTRDECFGGLVIPKPADPRDLAAGMVRLLK